MKTHKGKKTLFDRIVGIYWGLWILIITLWLFSSVLSLVFDIDFYGEGITSLLVSLGGILFLIFLLFVFLWLLYWAWELITGK